MKSVKYRRISGIDFIAEWSTSEVEHFLYFETYGSPKDYQTADFGLMNAEALAFARSSVRAYGRPLCQLMQGQQTPIQFSLGSLAAWGVRSSLTISENSPEQLANRISVDVHEHLFPIVRHVLSVERLLGFLVEEKDSHSWSRCNAAMRAAMIVNLGRQMKMESASIRELLSPRSNWIGYHLNNAPNPDPGWFITKLLEVSEN